MANEIKVNNEPKKSFGNNEIKREGGDSSDFSAFPVEDTSPGCPYCSTSDKKMKLNENGVCELCGYVKDY